MTIPEGATRSGRRPGRRRRPMTAWIFTPVFIVLFSTVFLALFSPVISWARGEGTPGLFVASDMDCHHGCQWFGEFISSGRKVVLPDMQYAGNAPAMKAGTIIPVVHVSSTLFGNIVYPRHPALRDLLWSSVWPEVVLALLLVVMFLRWIWTVPVRYWRWRKAVASGSPGIGGKRGPVPPPWFREGSQG